jgi:translocation and assembly module TamB
VVRHALGLAFFAVVAVIAAIIALATTQTGVDVLIHELIARSGGALEVEGATGTLVDTVRARRIAWRGVATKVEATDVALTWLPTGLFSRSIVLTGLGARALAIEIEPSDGTVGLPDSLALPIDVRIDRIAVGLLTWRVATGRGAVEGLEFGYTGGAGEHRMTGLRMVTRVGTLYGDATLGAITPFPLTGAFKLEGDATLRDARINLAAKGTLAALAVDVDGRAGEGRVTGHATLAPLAGVPLVALSIDARDVDLAAWDRALPATRIAATVDARPADGGLAGTVDATNAQAGNLDTGRTPVRAFRARFAWRPDAVEFDEIAAELEGGAKATGSARIALGANVSGGRWALELRDVDARQLYAPLVSTRLAGRIVADLDPARRTISGNLVDRRFVGGIAVDFAATFDERAIDVTRLRARANGGELAGSGRLGLDGQRTFTVAATATHVDPSRFGAYPAGSLDAKATASGELRPEWRVDADVAVAKGSHLAGAPLAGSIRGSASPNHLRNAVLDLAIGSATLKGSGSIGEAGDRMAATLDAPQLAVLVPLLGAAIPRTLDGALHMTAQMSGTPQSAGFDVTAKGTRLKVSETLAIGTLDAHAVVAPSAAAGARTDFASRSLQLDIDAADVKTPSGDVARANAHVAGSLAAHTVAIALDGGDIGLDAAAHGGLTGDIAKDAPTALGWAGTIDSLSGRGPWALRLASPASLSFGPRKAHLGEAHLTVADGTVDIGEFTWDDAKITSRGRFTALPAATVARLAGRPLPMHSTLTLGGEWSLAAAPRLTGSVSIHREQGDLWLARDDAGATASLAAGITELDASAQLRDDALKARAMFRSARGGNADATLAIDADPNAPPGRLSPAAPLALTLVADLTSLAILQPWTGTTAVVDGHVHLDLAAKGTMRDAPLTGTVQGKDLTIDAAQYGLHFKSGSINARLADRRITLDELAFSAGEGTFRATGTLATATSSAESAANVTWHAEKFRLFNRPDFNLVVSGNGALALTKGKVSLTGSLKADEGRFVYQFDPNATLGDDVVVKGWAPRAPDMLRSADVPLVVDVNLDFGDRLTFVGRGLDTGLRGQIRVRNGTSGFTGSGQLYTVNGTYFAYGQKLSIDPGRLIFNGPLDNPGLDIVALRRNLAVEAGVAVTGTVRVPIITLTSNPPVPDNEKLSWLVLGQSLDRTSGADLAALQAASAALLGPNSRPVTASIAQSIGLDDISVKSGTVAARNVARGTPDATGQVVSIGKRLSENLTVAYEQGLTVATNALRIEYALSSTLSVRAEAGTVSGLGLVYRRTFE